MGLPSINIEFIGKASNAITRSARGIVACIIKDDTEGIPAVQTYSTLNDVDFTKMSEANYEFMKLIFAASPYRVIVAAQAPDAARLYRSAEDIKGFKMELPYSARHYKGRNNIHRCLDQRAAGQQAQDI